MEVAHGVLRDSCLMNCADESDYVPLLDVILGFPADPFLSEGSTVCQTVSVIGDDVMEADETFTIVATPVMNIDVIIGPATVTIAIANGDDGKSEECI